MDASIPITHHDLPSTDVPQNIRTRLIQNRSQPPARPDSSEGMDNRSSAGGEARTQPPSADSVPGKKSQTPGTARPETIAADPEKRTKPTANPEAAAPRENPGGSPLDTDRDRDAVKRTRIDADQYRSSDRLPRTGAASEEAELVRELAARDREVRAHEMAHAAAGGRYAGHPAYTYEQGPDGRRYAVAGKVSIDTSKAGDEPEKTREKAETVRAAALAPANPSTKDRTIAAKASRMAAEARMEIMTRAYEAERMRTTGPGAEAGAGKDESGNPADPRTIKVINKYV